MRELQLRCSRQSNVCFAQRDSQSVAIKELFDSMKRGKEASKERREPKRYTVDNRPAGCVRSPRKPFPPQPFPSDLGIVSPITKRPRIFPGDHEGCCFRERARFYLPVTISTLRMPGSATFSSRTSRA